MTGRVDDGEERHAGAGVEAVPAGVMLDSQATTSMAEHAGVNAEMTAPAPSTRTGADVEELSENAVAYDDGVAGYIPAGWRAPASRKILVGSSLPAGCLNGVLVALHDDVDVVEGMSMITWHGGVWQRASDIQAMTSYLVVPDPQGDSSHDDTIQERAGSLGVHVIKWKEFEKLLKRCTVATCVPWSKEAATWRCYAKTAGLAPYDAAAERKRKRTDEEHSDEALC